jgi:lysophospholipase L1-like esterase
MSGATAPRPLPRLHVCGDSISMQYGPHLERMLGGIAGYSRKSGKQGDLDRPEGANGGDSGMVLAYLRELAAATTEPFALLLVNCGLHDIKCSGQPPRRQVEPDAYHSNLKAIAQLSPRIARHLVWIRSTHVVDALHAKHCTAGFSRVDADVDRYNGLADEVMRRAGAHLIDLNGFTRALGGDEIVCDHVHFAEPIRVQQAAFIAGHVAALLGGTR